MPYLDEDGVTRLTEDYLDIFAPIEELGEGDGTDAGPIYELTAKGHAEQFSTTGKNLLPRFMSKSDSNITFTANADGSVTINGVAVDENKQVSVSGIYLPAGVYTISGCPSGGGANAYYIFPWDVTTGARPKNESGNDASTDFGSGATFVAVEGHETRIIIRMMMGYTVSNLTFYPQLEAGSTATPYEPYTGGAPSPSPDYPQEIQVVRGRNLLDKSLFVSINDVMVAQTANGVRVSASSGANKAVNVSIADLGLVNGQTYTIASDVTVTAGLTRISIRNSAYNVIAGSSGSTSSGRHVATFTYDSSIHSMISLFCTGGTSSAGDVTYANLQLERGSIAHPYVPYGHVGMDVQGKNLFRYVMQSLTHNAITYAKNSDGSMTLTGSTTSSVSFSVPNTSYYPTEKILLVAGTYTISGALPNVPLQVMSVVNNADNVELVRTTSRQTFTVSEDTYVIVRCRIPVNTTTNVTVYPMLELGSEATPYEPYYHTTTPIPLPDRGWVGGLPDGTSDILTLDGAGKCEWELPTSMETFDGSSDESWNNMESAQIQNILLSNSAVNGVGMFTHAIRDSATTSSGQFNVAANRLYFNAGFSSVDSMRAFLEAHSASLLYKLATPIYESKGYIEDWPTDIPEGATITIPELDALNVKYFVANDSISQYADQWYERTKGVDIAQVEDAVVELTENLVDLTTLDPIGGLERASDGARIGSLVQESDGYARGGLAEVTAKGHAEQFSTTGKNLFRLQNNGGTGFSVARLKDGVTVTATTTTTKGYAYFNTTAGAGTYTFSFSTTSSSYQVTIYARDASNNTLANKQINSGTSVTITTPADTAYIRVDLYARGVASGNIGDSTTYMYPQLELGSEATEYEPYTGGAPSPSPDYPQEIQVVRGRNLADTSALNVIDAYTDSSGTVVSSVSDRSLIIAVSSSTQYTFSGTHILTTSNTDDWIISEYAELPAGGVNGTKLTASYSNQLTYTFTTTETTKYVLIKFANTARIDISATLATIQLTLGSTPQPYVPYGHVGMDYSYVPHGNWEQGSVSSTIGYTYEQNKRSDISRVRIKTLLPVVSGTTLIATCASGYQFGIHTYKDGKLVSSNAWASSASYVVTNFNEIALIVRKTSNASINVSEIGNANLIVRGIIPTTPIPLPQRGWVAGLPDGTSDILTLDGAGKVEWELNDDEAVLDGGFIQPSSSSYPSIFAKDIDDALSITGVGNYSHVSSTYRNTTRAWSAISTNESSMYLSVLTSGKTALTVKDTRFMSASDFNAWLSTHPVTVLYPLATPVIEDMGYVDMPDIPSDCIITIPELDALGIRYFVDNSVTEYGKQIYARAYAELGDAIVELTERVAELEQQ